MAHALIKATITPAIIGMIAQWLDIDEDKALDFFYESATAASLSDDETGLYGQSALYIFSLFKEEWKTRQLP